MGVSAVEHLWLDQLVQARPKHVLLGLDPEIAAGIKEPQQPVAEPQRTAAYVKHARRRRQALPQEHVETGATDAFKIPYRAAVEPRLGEAFRSRLQRVLAHSGSLAWPRHALDTGAGSTIPVQWERWDR
jgi:hypothetical protein